MIVEILIESIPKESKIESMTREIYIESKTYESVVMKYSIEVMAIKNEFNRNPMETLNEYVASGFYI